MPTVVTPSAHSQTDIALVEQRYTADQRLIRDRFVACQVGGMLLLKLAGFIEDEQAEITSISEEQVTLRLGRPLWRRWFGQGRERRRPVEVQISFADPGEEMESWKRSSARRSAVDVMIRPLTSSFSSREFQRRADGILRMLRLHFVAD